jgi:hypothetical protein
MAVERGIDVHHQTVKVIECNIHRGKCGIYRNQIIENSSLVIVRECPVGVIPYAFGDMSFARASYLIYGFQ